MTLFTFFFFTGLVGLVTWFLAVGVVWYTAYRYAFPLVFAKDDATSQWRDFKKQFAKNRVGVGGISRDPTD